jgi:hypothetical protein
MSGAKPRHSCTSLFMRLKILPLPCEYIFSLMNFVAYNKRTFPHKFGYTMLIQGTGTICTDELPNSVLEKVHTVLRSRYSTVYHLVSIKRRSLKHH